MNNIGELVMGVAIIAVAAIFGVRKQDKEFRPSHLNVCIEQKTQTIWSDQWQECFKRYEGGHCGPCGSEGKCPDVKQDTTCVFIP